jgi:hypothetical protein
MRPLVPASVGAVSTFPPACSTRATAASASWVDAYQLHAVCCSSDLSGPAPATGSPPRWKIV